MRVRHVLITIQIAVLVLAAAAGRSVGAPRAEVPVTRLDLGSVVRGAVVERDLVLSNTGTAVLEVFRVRLTPPLRLIRMPARVAPGAEALLRVQVDTSNLEGPIEGELRVLLNDPALPEARVTVEGLVVPPVEVAPRPAVFLSARRGERREAVLEIINHETEPLRIVRVEHAGDRIGATLDEVEKGRRFRLRLQLRPDGPSGKAQSAVVLTTSSRTEPRVRIAVHTLLRERVYTFPDTVDLGALPMSELRLNPDLERVMSQTLMVYGPPGFEIRLRTDVPGLRLVSEPGRHRDRHQVTIGLESKHLQPGAVTGTIYIDTNDAEFPTITVPVSGSILAR